MIFSTNYWCFFLYFSIKRSHAFIGLFVRVCLSLAMCLRIATCVTCATIVVWVFTSLYLRLRCTWEHACIFVHLQYVMRWWVCSLMIKQYRILAALHNKNGKPPSRCVHPPICLTASLRPTSSWKLGRDLSYAQMQTSAQIIDDHSLHSTKQQKNQTPRHRWLEPLSFEPKSESLECKRNKTAQ